MTAPVVGYDRLFGVLFEESPGRWRYLSYESTHGAARAFLDSIVKGGRVQVVKILDEKRIGTR